MLTFHDWLQLGEVPKKPSPANSLVPTIAAAGPKGMSRAEIGQRIDLPRQVLDELLARLADVGQLWWRQEKDDTIWRTVPWVRAVAAHSSEEEGRVRKLR